MAATPSGTTPDLVDVAGQLITSIAIEAVERASRSTRIDESTLVLLHRCVRSVRAWVRSDGLCVLHAAKGCKDSSLRELALPGRGSERSRVARRSRHPHSKPKEARRERCLDLGRVIFGGLRATQDSELGVQRREPGCPRAGPGARAAEQRVADTGGGQGGASRSPLHRDAASRIVSNRAQWWRSRGSHMRPSSAAAAVVRIRSSSGSPASLPLLFKMSRFLMVDSSRAGRQQNGPAGG